MSVPLLAAERVSKSFDGFRVLDDVSFSMPDGALTGIAGTNGAGKSTLFAIVGGQLAPDAGTVMLRGASIVDAPARRRAALGLGRTFQVPREFPHLTVRENLLVAAKRDYGETLRSVFAGWSRVASEERTLRERADGWLRFLSLDAVGGQRAGLLSGGQKKLLELGRMLMLEPACILLDEPFAGVNAVLVDEICGMHPPTECRAGDRLPDHRAQSAGAEGAGQAPLRDGSGARHRAGRARGRAGRSAGARSVYGRRRLMLTVDDLRGGYGAVDILHRVSVHVGEREIVTIAGTNGAGKSTFAKGVIGLLPRCQGRIVLAGRDIAGLAVEDRIAAGLGYVPQVANVFPSLTVLENLKVVPAGPQASQRIARLIDTFQALKPRLAQRAGTLSGGERQQLAFARALLAEPKLIVLDEPTAALAPGLVRQVFDVVARLPSLGVAVLMVEQRARQALSISDRGYILDQGRVVLNGAAAELLADDRMARLYLGAAH